MNAVLTPGPWHVANLVQIRSERHQIAKVWVTRNGQFMANAQLIAAAPELLEALKGVLLVADRQTDEFDAARAAIAKATRSAL